MRGQRTEDGEQRTENREPPSPLLRTQHSGLLPMFNLFPTRKAPPMSQRTDAPPAPPDVNQQIAALTSAVQQLADSHKSVLERMQPSSSSGNSSLSASDVLRIVGESLAAQQHSTRVSGA